MGVIALTLFSPFFFIGIGMEMNLVELASAAWLGVALLLLALASKFLATSAPVYLLRGWSSAILLGASMTPRAEITMVIVQRAHKLGDWAMPDHLHAAIIATCAGTCLAGPLAVRWLLERHPEKAAARSDSSKDTEKNRS